MGDVELAALLRRNGIQDRRVLEAISNLSRADFVPRESVAVARVDAPLPIGHGQTISQPFVVAAMTQALNLQDDDRVLEVGTGSGYQTAVLATLCGEVYSLEIIPQLARAASERLTHLGFLNVYCRQGDGRTGWLEAAPFDAILVGAAADRIPPALLEQLRPGGRLVLPLGPTEGVQELILVRRPLMGEVPSIHRLMSVRFVPLRHPPPAHYFH